MAKKTSNYGLTKPLQEDFYDVDVQNANMDIIDAQLKNIDDKVKSVEDEMDDLSTDAGDLTGTLPVAHGGTGATTASGALNNLGAAPINHDHYYAGSSTKGGSATSAEKLTKERLLLVDLSTTSYGVFDGSADCKRIGATGILPVTFGGTGANTREGAQSQLGIVPITYGTSDLTAGSSTLETGKLYFVYE